MKKVKAQIKSQTRVKSMLDFSDDEENVNKGVVTKNDNILTKNDNIPAQNDKNVAKNDANIAKNDANIAKNDKNIAKKGAKVKQDSAKVKQDEDVISDSGAKNNDNIFAKDDDTLAKKSAKVKQKGASAKQDDGVINESVAQNKARKTKKAGGRGVGASSNDDDVLDAQNVVVTIDEVGQDSVAQNNGDAQNAQNVVVSNDKGAPDDDGARDGGATNGVVVLNRKRGDVVVSGQAEQETDEQVSAEADAPKSRHVVEIGSKTYGGADDNLSENTDGQAVREKRTFKDYMRLAGTAVAQGWDTFINKKGAVRFLAIIAVFVMLTIALIIYSAGQRTNFKDIVNGNCYALVYDAGDTGGVGKYEQIKLSTLTRETPSEKLCKNYSAIELIAKEKNKAINFDTISFGLYTASADVTIVINIEVYVNEERVWTLESPKTISPKQRVGNGVDFQVGQSFNFHKGTYIRLTFACYDTAEFEKHGTDAPLINPQFAVYKLAYTA